MKTAIFVSDEVFELSEIPAKKLKVLRNPVIMKMAALSFPKEEW